MTQNTKQPFQASSQQDIDTLPKVSLAPDTEIFERNLAAITRRSPKAADQIRKATSSTQIEFSLTPTGELVGILDGRAMCSKRRPADEANAWAQQYDPQHCGFLGIQGFGLGHHLRALFKDHAGMSVLMCFEPDLDMLRAVLEHIDHSDWINQSIFLLATDPDDAPGISQLITGAEAFLATGVEITAHPPSTKRLGDSASKFSATLLNVVKSTRTHLVTILAHSGFTLRNILMNAGTYATSSGIVPLKDSCQGRTAILISAGPSLQRNLHLLQDPSIRERAVIIAVQTMLKPLLEQGIKPHFITALDHHEISKRFYEGLTEQEVDGVRLIVEPKANAAIVETFPGEILCAKEPHLDELLGPQLARDMGSIPAGATVAHLNYYLAKYMGCTNIILIGQDLGFTDGQYYSAGASIHQVWAGELSEHRTLEMFEWERIARMKSLLRIKEDIHGRPIFTDEQMSTYIARFESDFQEDTQNNSDLKIINATEGGVKIAGAQVMTLKEALSDCLTDDPINLPETRSQTQCNPEHNHKLKARIRTILGQLQTIERNSKRTIELNKKAQKSVGNPAQVDRHIQSMHAIRDQVLALQPAFDMVNFYNQKGGLNRFKVDRGIKLLHDLSPEERMVKQLDRDAHNVAWIKESASEVARLLSRALSVIEGTASPMTRDEFADEEPTIESESESETGNTPRRRVEAIIFADTTLGPLGSPRDLTLPVHQELNALEITIARLQQTSELDGITIITPQTDVVESMSFADSPCRVRIVYIDQKLLRSRIQAVGTARSASSECWRGSIGSLGCYDEGLVPSALVGVMEEYKIDAAAIVGPDWAMVDPVLVDRIVARHRASPDRCRIPFSQAVPGIGCSVLDRNAADALDKATKVSSTFGSIGAMFGYIPIGPQGDPIASPLCVGVDPSIRDAGVRAIADSPARKQAMSTLFAGLGKSIETIDSKSLLKGYTKELEHLESIAPRRIELELTTNRIAAGLWGNQHQCQIPDHQITLDQASKLFKEALSLRPECSLLVSGRGDPLTRPDALSFVSRAKECGISSVELRTDFFDNTHTPENIVSSGVDVVSIDVLTDSHAGYEEMTGSKNFESFLDRIQSLFNARTTKTQTTKEGQLPTPWIVPRITRNLQSYLAIQPFYDRWLTICGCAIIDPNTAANPNDRIQPLPVPTRRAHQLAAHTLRIQCDGQVINHLGQPVPNTNAFKLGIEQSYKNFRQSLDQSTESNIEPKAIQEPAPIT
ncbi:MAG: motility associated factor glycosyltransferase family protein [Phycisphaerales bacterium]|nr:motility associated factor glycosyltransferase family protein [Phycisphaerales bacterium]